MSFALACAALALSCAPQGRRDAQVAVLDAGAGRSVHDGLEGDVDGDGHADLVLAAAREGGGRELLVFRARADAGAARFASPADATIELTPDAVAWALGEVDASSRGAEIVLLSARGAFACRPFAPAEQRFARLCECELLWQLAEPDACFAYPEALADVDGDGALDLVLPEPQGYALARQVRTASASTFPALARLRVPLELHAGDDSGGRGGGMRLERSDGERAISVSFGARDGGPRTLLSISDSVPAPQLADFDGDGKLDVLAQGVRSLWIWQQTGEGSFPQAPQRADPLPVLADRDRRLDASYSAHVLDANQDGRADVAILAGDRRSEDVRTQMLLFLNGEGRGDAAKSAAAPLFGPKGLPQQLLVLGGFSAGADFVDLDGDRLPEMLVRTVRPDLIDQIRSASSESLDADVLVYRNEGGTWSRKPALSWRVSVPLREFDLTLRPIGDVDGDRLSDLVVRTEPERLRVVALRRAKEGWQVDAKPLYETAIDPDARILLLARPGEPRSDVAVLEGSQVHLVRFR